MILYCICFCIAVLTKLNKENTEGKVNEHLFAVELEEMNENACSAPRGGFSKAKYSESKALNLELYFGTGFFFVGLIKD